MIRSFIKALLPARVLRTLKDWRRDNRRKAWQRQVENNPAARVDKKVLVGHLRSLGVRPGQDLLVHSSLSRLGMVEGGAESVIAALQEVMGPDATLLMPAYPMQSSMLDTMNDSSTFDVRSTASTMGKITEVFRLRPGAYRSAHPTHSVAAEGPSAKDYIADHHYSRSPCGAGSPFRKLAENGGAILCLGTGVGKVTSHHVIEDQVDDFPLPVYVERLFEKRVRFDDDTFAMVEVRVHNPQFAAIRVDNHAGKEQQILAEMRARRIVREGSVGLAPSHLFNAVDLNLMLTDLLARGVTIYETTKIGLE